jgi:hypothetical protein
METMPETVRWWWCDNTVDTVWKCRLEIPML